MDFFKSMLEACFSSFQSFQTINYHQTIEIVGSIRNEIIPTMKKLLNGQVTTQSKTSMEIRAESKKLLEQFEKLTKVLIFLKNYKNNYFS